MKQKAIIEQKKNGKSKSGTKKTENRKSTKKKKSLIPMEELLQAKGKDCRMQKCPP